MAEEKDAKDGDKNCSIEFFKSAEYHKLLPQDDASWLETELDLGSDPYTDIHVKDFHVPDSYANHPYYKLMVETMETFRMWYSWKLVKNKQEDGWKPGVAKGGCKTYWNKFKNTSISCVRGEMDVPYNAQVFLGHLLNEKSIQLRTEADTHMRKVVKTLSATSCVVYTQSKPVMALVAARDILEAKWIFYLPNFEYLLCDASIPDEKNEYQVQNKKYQRANLTANIWHIRPLYKSEIAQKNYSGKAWCKCVNYCHLDPGGWVPQKLVDARIADKPMCILKCKEFLDGLKASNKLHKNNEEWSLYIPKIALMPLLKAKSAVELVKKEYVLKGYDEQKASATCLDKDFKEISFDISKCKSDDKQKIVDVLKEGEKEKKDVKVTLIFKNSQVVGLHQVVLG